MSFAEYYILKERFKPTREDRFLAIAIDVKTWYKYISKITSVWEENQIYQPLRFIITDKSGLFVIYLDWDSREKVYNYKFDKSTIPYLSERGLNEDNAEVRPWCYYDEAKNIIVTNGETEKGKYSHQIKNNFSKGELIEFLHDIFIANGIWETKSKLTVIYALYFIDKLSLEYSLKIKRNKTTPNWLEYTMKDDEFRKSDKGIFGAFFK